jgi:hypothetical protein
MLENSWYKIIRVPTNVVYSFDMPILLVVNKHRITSVRNMHTLTLNTRSTEPLKTEYGVQTVVCLPRLHWGTQQRRAIRLPSACFKSKKIYRTQVFYTIHSRERIDGKFAWNEKQTNLDTIIKRKTHKLVKHVRTRTEKEQHFFKLTTEIG